MLQVLENLDGVVVYGGDIATFSKMVEEHVSRMEAPLERINMVGRNSSAKKCQTVRDRITYLEHVVSGGEIAPLPEKRNTLQL